MRALRQQSALLAWKSPQKQYFVKEIDVNVERGRREYKAGIKDQFIQQDISTPTKIQH